MNSQHDRVYLPRYLLRRNLVLHLLRRYKPGRFLEIGCGSAELMPWLCEQGFEGIGLEISSEVLPLARKTVLPYGPKLQIIHEACTLKSERFQYVLALEVLEHLKEDAAALVAWKEYLEPPGRLILSVPARMKKWTTSDEAVGHYRRYERNDLQQLLKACGYTVESLWSYGFPLTSLTSIVRDILYRLRLKRFQNSTRQDRTLHSSLESTWTPRRGTQLARVAVEGIALSFHFAQLPFLSLDLGDGYLVSCKLSS